MFATPLFARTLREVIRREPPDAILCPMWLPDGAACRWALGGSPSRTSSPPTAPRSSRISRRCATAFGPCWRAGSSGGCSARRTKVFPVSAYTGRAVLEETGADPDRVVVVHNGVNPAIFKRTPVSPAEEARYRPHGERLLLTVTRLYPYKGVDRMLEALPAIAEAVPDVQYLVVGEGPDLPRLQRLAAGLGLQDRVPSWGEDRRGDREPLQPGRSVRAAHAGGAARRGGLRPGVPGGRGLGLPSLGGRSGGIPEAVEEGRTGWLVDPGDPRAIAATRDRPAGVPRAAAPRLGALPPHRSGSEPGSGSRSGSPKRCSPART